MSKERHDGALMSVLGRLRPLNIVYQENERVSSNSLNN